MTQNVNSLGCEVQPQLRRHRLSAGCAVGVLAAALLAPAIGPAPPASAQTVQTIKVKAKEAPGGKYIFEGLPSSLKGGNIALEFTNAGKDENDLGILRIDGNHSLAEVIKIISSESTPTPGWMHAAGGIGRIPPGTVGRATVNLAAGKYLWMSTVSNETTKVSHAAGGMAKAITVTGPKAAALPSGATATITAKEYGFETKGLKAGKNMVRFTNAGKELHHFQMLPIVAGKTIADVQAMFTSQAEPTGPPPVDFEKGQGSAVIERSEGDILTEVNLTAGRYAVVCFMSDRAGGPPHFMKGMLTEMLIK